MRIKNIGFKGFRSLADGFVSTDHDIVILEGANGMGKTSFLEAIYFSLFLSSFRTKNTEELINFNENNLIISSLVSEKGYDYRLKTSLSNFKKNISVNEKAVKRLSDLLNLFPCVFFSYDDKTIITREPKLRRNFINQILFFYDPFFSFLLKKYNNLLKQRNVLLKGKKDSMLDVYDEQISKEGFEIYKKRDVIIKVLQECVNDLYSELFCMDVDFKAVYKSQCSEVESEADYMGMLVKNRNNDFKYLSTTFGIHSDDVIFKFKGYGIKESASTGQIRLLSIILRLAETMIIYNKNNVSPLILIDDVFLEMDEDKKKILFSYLAHFEQVFYTFMPGEIFYKDAFNQDYDIMKYTVKSGRFYAEH